MNMPLQGVHSMRIIALPLARVKVPRNAKIKPCADSNVSTLLVYYHFDLILPRDDHEDLSWHNKVLKNMMNKAEDLWTSLGKAPKSSWKLWTYELGERIADRIEFEELALKDVDPSLGPIVPLTRTDELISDVHGNSRRSHSFRRIPLTYPPSLYPNCSVIEEDHALLPPLAHLHTLLASRGPRHRRGFYLWMLIAPLTAPIALIPLIPNLPLFFCIWRSWSHYRAYRSSQYLSSLLDHGTIEPDPSSELDKLYASFASSSGISTNSPPPVLESRSPRKDSTARDVDSDRKSEAASRTGETRSERMLLTHEAMPRMLQTLGLPESTAVNIHRAIDQVRKRLGASSSSSSSSSDVS